MLRSLIILGGALIAAGCSGPSSDPGLDALLVVGSAQFYRGAPPSDVSGEKLVQLNTSMTVVQPGRSGYSVAGYAPPMATGVIIYLEGDVGYWVIAPTVADPNNNYNLQYSAPMSFSALLPEGMYSLVGRAVDINGHVGPPFTTKFQVMDFGSPGGPTTLLVSLRWDTEADVDLHLVVPDGTEIYSNKINSYNQPPFGQPMDPNAWKGGGILDFDSNATCIIDGRRVENIYWTQTPPSGHYIARVGTYSMCAEAYANWSVAVTLNGNNLGVAHGSSRDTDALAPRGKGSGLTAIEFDVP